MKCVLSTTLARLLKSEGIDVVTGARCIKASRSGDKKVVTARQGDQLLNFEADEHLRTSASNFLAIGDVIGGYLFTHVAACQAGIAVRNALVPVGKKKVDYRVVPWCTFTDPEVARLGMTPDEAEKHYKKVRIVKFPWAEIDRAQAECETTGFIKLVLAGKKDEIVGAHMVGARAGEILGELSLAMQHNLTLNDILNTIYAYPTMNTGIQQAVFETYLEGSAAANTRKIVRTVLSLRG